MLRAPLASPYRWLSVRQEARVEGSPESRRKAEWSPSLSCHANGLLGHSLSSYLSSYANGDLWLRTFCPRDTALQVRVNVMLR